MGFVDGSGMDFDYANGQELIHELLSDDWGPPPVSLSIKAFTKDGKKVIIRIPYDKDDDEVFVEIE